MRFRPSDVPWYVRYQLLEMQSTTTSCSNDFIRHSTFVERLYLGLVPSSAIGRKLSLPTVRDPKCRWSRVVFPRAVSSVRFCSCSTRQTWHVPSRYTELTFTDDMKLYIHSTADETALLFLMSFHA